MSTLEVKELSHPTGEVLKIATGKTLDLKSQGTTTLPAGSVLQVVEANFQSQVTFTSASYADSGLSATITPKSSSSKILVTANVQGNINGTGQIGINLVRGSTQIEESNCALGWQDNTSAMMTLTELDSPSTASAVTYKVQMKRTQGSGTMRLNQNNASLVGNSKITLMEIQG